MLINVYKLVSTNAQNNYKLKNFMNIYITKIYKYAVKCISKHICTHIWQGIV